jgi:hypothetical protein
MIHITKKLKNFFQQRKGKRFISFIRGENDYSNTVALAGFSVVEIDTISNFLQKVRKNIEIVWEYVKKGNKRKY